MENKEKRKRRVSIFTMFLWLALIVTMSVVVMSGISKSNALEDDEKKEITIKIDFTELLQNDEIEESEVETFLEDYTKNIWMANVTYVGNEENKIGIYKGNISSSEKRIRIDSDGYYDYISNDELLELNCYSGKSVYFKEIIEDIDEYNFVIKKKDKRKVTVKIDFNDLIKNRGITEQSEVETLLSKYYTRLTGRKDKYSLSQTINPISEYINLKSKYIGSEKNTIGIYEIEIPEDIKYIQVVKTLDPEYLEISFLEEYDMLFEGRPLEITRISENTYMDFSKTLPQPYVLPVMDNVDEYNIDIKEKEKITVNLSSDITKVDVVNNTSKIIEKITIKDGEFNLKLSKDAEYDLIFVPEKDLYYRTKYRGVYEDGNELEQKMIYTPSANEEIYNYHKTIKQGENKSEYTFDTSGRFESSIVWEDNKKAKLNFEVKENWKYYYRSNLYYDGYYHENKIEYVIFIEKLDENFSVAQEYENDPEWLIVNEDEIKDTKFEIPDYAKRYLKLDLENNKYIPEYVYANFFEGKYGESFLQTNIKINEKIYNIYIKDKNMLYCLIPINKPNNQLLVNLEYNGDESRENKIFKFNTKSIFLYNVGNSCTSMNEQPYSGATLVEKQIKYGENKKTRIVVNKLLENKTENRECYIGLFENDEEDTTDKIYDMNIENGVGSIKIEFEGYYENKKYYVYEVDEKGNKISDEKITYSKNKVLENISKREEYNVSSDKSIVSSVYSTLANEGSIGIELVNGEKNQLTHKIGTLSEDMGKGSGEAYYNDNSLVATEVYEDVVTISENNEKAYLVRYETKKGGTLEGDTEEIVIEGEKPVNVPNVKVKENYEFEKWVVIEDGEEIEVNPEEYVILEDTTFIAKYKEIKVVDEIDTSDINVWLYVGIAVISVICVIIVIMSLRINKKRKTT